MRGPWPGRLALVAVLGLLGGRAGLLVGLALAAYEAVRSPSLVASPNGRSIPRKNNQAFYYLSGTPYEFAFQCVAFVARRSHGAIPAGWLQHAAEDQRRSA